VLLEYWLEDNGKIVLLITIHIPVLRTMTSIYINCQALYMGDNPVNGYHYKALHANCACTVKVHHTLKAHAYVAVICIRLIQPHATTPTNSA